MKYKFRVMNGKIVITNKWGKQILSAPGDSAAVFKNAVAVKHGGTVTIYDLPDATVRKVIEMWKNNALLG